MKVSQFISTRFNKAVKNHFVIVDDTGNMLFQSYDKVAAEVSADKSEMKIYSNWNYSPTTRKYFLDFMVQQFGVPLTETAIAKMIEKKQFGEIRVEYVQYEDF